MDYSIIIPVYNSSSTLNELLLRLTSTMQKYWHEIILVDDGSTDDSWKQLLKLRNNYHDKNIKIIKLKKNFGQHNATMCGLKYAVGNYAITIDDDLQIPPEEIHKLILQSDISSADIVYGVFKVKQQPLHRRLLKKIAFNFINRISPIVVKKSSFRIIHKKIVEHLNKHSTHFLNIDEIAQWYINSISTIEVEHVNRKEGESGYTIFGLIKIAIRTLFNFYEFPLQLITFIGFYTSIFSIFLGIFYLLKKIFFQVGIEGWTSLMVVLLFSTGIIVFSLGIIGKYLLKIISVQNGKPAFIVDIIKE